MKSLIHRRHRAAAGSFPVLALFIHGMNFLVMVNRHRGLLQFLLCCGASISRVMSNLCFNSIVSSSNVHLWAKAADGRDPFGDLLRFLNPVLDKDCDQDERHLVSFEGMHGVRVPYLVG
uniref:Uncharacterized protein n=1 Tax=Grammatophora oceanica TaxID=210454 RepID=A0A7S1Y1N1_9STRA